MKRLLDDYIFSPELRYEGHRLRYTQENCEMLELGGIMGAAVLAALLVDTDEGDARGINVDGEQPRNEFFLRYEREVRRDNGGLFLTEVEALSESYTELTGTDDLLLCICGNDRLLDLALSLMVEYMRRLVREEVHAHIYEAVPWTTPFAQWLFNAGFVETRRQQLLSIDWTKADTVYALAQRLATNDAHEAEEPTLVFDGLSAEQVIRGYWEWLWQGAQNEANLYPDDKVQLARIKQIIRENEADYDFLKPEMKCFSPASVNLFRKWMTQWQDFLNKQLPPEEAPKKHIQQELFMDNVLPAPQKGKYDQVREYILERQKYDKNFKKFYQTRKRTELCLQLSVMFGWAVSDNSLGKSMRRKLKHPKKSVLQ